MKKSYTLISICLLLSISAKSQFWITQNVGPVNTDFYFNKITSLDNNNAWGLSIYGKLVGRTVDGGNTWDVDSTPSNDFSTCFQALSIDTAWISTSAIDTAWLWKTTDGGHSWIKIVQVGTHCDFFHFFNSNDAVTFSDPVNGNWPAFITSDGGVTWSPVTVPAPNPNEACMDLHHYVYGNHIWSTSTEGRLFHSSDKGQTWTVSLIDSANFPDNFRVAFYSELEGIGIRHDAGSGEVIDIYRSHDGGITWNTIPHTGTISQSFFGGFFIVPNSSVVFANGEGFSKFGSSYSIDSGATWTLIDSTIKYGALDGKDWNSLWSGQYSTSFGVGGVAKWDGTTLNVPVMSSSNSISIYPNPANEVLFVRSRLNIEEVKIFDLSGRQVKWIKIHSLEKQIDITDLSEGVYFLQINSGNKISTKKFIKCLNDL